jgi:glycosyltransferase involved in cell wall biosynthesis
MQGKFVVMYSGNHSPCHPLDTVLEAARELAGKDILFAFIGGGSQLPRVRQFADDHGLANIICLPYQPLEQLSASLSAADLHLVVMGKPFVGLVHPCKIYNALLIGSPICYIGPSPSHVTEILQDCDDLIHGQAEHGDVQAVIENILRIKEAAPRFLPETAPLRSRRFSEEALLPRFVRLVESLGEGKQAAGMAVEGLAMEQELKTDLTAGN